MSTSNVVNISEYFKKHTIEVNSNYYYFPFDCQNETTARTITQEQAQAADFQEPTAVVNNALIMAALARIERGQQDHDEKTTSNHTELLSELNQLRRDNEYYKNSLASIYTPQKLKNNSIFFLSIAILSLYLGGKINIYLIHPTVAYVTIAACIVFFIMAKIMEYKDRSIDG